MKCGTMKAVISFLVVVVIGWFGYNNLDKKIESLSVSEKKIQPFSEQQSRAIEEIIKTTIKKNPDAIVEAMNVAIHAQQVKLKESMEVELLKHKEKLSKGIVLGNPLGEAKISVVMDPLCPHCLECQQIIHEILDKRKDVAVHMYYVGLLGPNSAALAKTYIAAAKQGTDKLEKLAYKIATNKEQLSKAKLLSIATEIGLNAKTLESDEISKEVSDILDKNTKLAEEIRLPGVPFIVGFFAKSDDCIIIPPVDIASMNSMLDKLKGDKTAALTS